MQPDFELWVSECVCISKLPPLLPYNFMLVFALRVSAMLISLTYQVSGLDLLNTPPWPDIPLLLPYSSGSQSAATWSSPPLPRGHLAMSGDILGLLASEWLGARYTAKHPTRHSAAPQQRLIQPKNSTNAEISNPRIGSLCPSSPPPGHPLTPRIPSWNTNGIPRLTLQK